MFKLEERFVDFLKKHLYFLMGALVLILSIVIRYSGRDFLSGDGEVFLKPWYDVIVEKGRWNIMGEQVGNYNMFYQFLITMGSYLPIHGMYVYKIYSIIFDYVLAFGVGAVVYHLSGEEKLRRAFVAFSCIVLNPIIYLNSAFWAQCDAMYVSCIILGILAMLKDKNILAFVAFGMAFAFKLQAVFILPFLLFIWFARKKFSALNFLLLPGMLIVCSIPGLICGREFINIFDIYFYQVGSYPLVSLNYPSAWLLLGEGYAYDYLHVPAIATTLVLLAAIMLFLVRKKVTIDKKNMVQIAFILAYTSVLFLPSMHERYGYLYEVLALIIVFLDIKTLPLYLGLQFITVCTYGRYLFEISYINLFTLTIINIVVYLFYLGHFYKNIQKKQQLLQ